MSTKIQHTVLFRLPELARGSEGEAAMFAVVAKFGSLPGITCSFASHGTATLEKKEALEALEWADRTDGYTHCLLVIADCEASLKAYLHHEFHLVDWMAVVKPYIQGIMVFDSKLALALDAKAAECLHPVFFKLPQVAVGDEAHAAIMRVVARFNALEGISASLEPHLGADFLAAVAWPDKALGFNYCLTVVAKDSAALKTYLHSQPHADWVPVVRPHFGTDAPFTLVFDTPLTIAVAL